MNNFETDDVFLCSLTGAGGKSGYLVVGKGLLVLQHVGQSSHPGPADHSDQGPVLGPLQEVVGQTLHGFVRVPGNDRVGHDLKNIS